MRSHNESFLCQFLTTVRPSYSLTALSTAMYEATLQYLILASVEGLGCRGVHRLLNFYEEPAAILRATVAELATQGLPEVLAKMLLSEARRAQADAELGNCLQNGIRILTLADPAYPKLLKEIFDPPIVLF